MIGDRTEKKRGSGSRFYLYPELDTERKTKENCKMESQLCQLWELHVDPVFLFLFFLFPFFFRECFVIFKFSSIFSIKIVIYVRN